MADQEILLDSDLEAVEPAQPKGRNWLKLLSLALLVAAVGVIAVAALPKALAPLSADTVELYGYSLSDDARAKYDQMKVRHLFSYVIYEIKGTEIETTTLGHWATGKEPSERVKELVDKLPANAPRYAVLDLSNKLILIHWSPHDASTRARMMYAGAAHKLQAFQGIYEKVTANEKSDITLEKLRKKLPF